MAFTAYCQLAHSGASQIAPAQFTSTVDYNIVNTANQNLVTLANGTTSGEIDVTLTPPITQNSVLASLQSAVQAAEPGTPGLTFVWLEL